MFSTTPDDGVGATKACRQLCLAGRVAQINNQVGVTVMCGKGAIAPLRKALLCRAGLLQRDQGMNRVMEIAQPVMATDMVAQYRENRWRKMLAENKMDMGLMDASEILDLDQALFRAVLSNKSLEVRELTRRGANPNQSLEDGTPLLVQACARVLDGHVTLETLIALLQSGADPLFVGASGLTARHRLAGEKTPAAARLRTVLQLWERRVNTGLAAPANDDRLVEGSEKDISKEVLRS